jgi:hypothetical protein
MQRLVSLILIYSIVGITIQLHELIKIPVLINHYSYHSDIARGETILHFLYNHYVQNNEKESSKDQQNDSSLPFNSKHSSFAHLIPFIKQEAFAITLISLINNPVIPDDQAVLHSQYSDIWKPPQIF